MLRLASTCAQDFLRGNVRVRTFERASGPRGLPLHGCTPHQCLAPLTSVSAVWMPGRPHKKGSLRWQGVPGRGWRRTFDEVFLPRPGPNGVVADLHPSLHKPELRRVTMPLGSGWAHTLSLVLKQRRMSVGVPSRRTHWKPSAAASAAWTSRSPSRKASVSWMRGCART